MTQWSKEDLEEMCGDDVIDQLAFIAGCNKHRYSNDKVVPDGWIIPDESLRKFAELIVRECIQICQSEYNEFTEIAAKNNGRESDFAFGRIDSAERIKDNIKEHFGVEE